MITPARGTSAQLFAVSQSQTFYVKNSLHQASATKISSCWKDGAGGEERQEERKG